jgi:hypothetical protein
MKIILLFAFFVASLQLMSQDSPEPTGKIFTKENAFIGGNVTLPLLSILQGSKNVMIGANPHFGYVISKNMDVAAVLNIQKNKFEVSQQSILNLVNNSAISRVSILGLGAFTRLYVLDMAFLQIQPELNYITNKETSFILNTTTLKLVETNSKNSKVKPSLLVGAGYKRGFNSGKTFGYVSIMYDLISKNSPYSNAVVSTITSSSNSAPVFLRAGLNIMLNDLKRRNQ